MGFPIHASAMSSASPSPLKKPSSSISKKTHYDVLQILPTAKAEEIKAAYRSLIIHSHPDKLPSVSKNDRDQNHVQISEGLSSIDFDDDDEESDCKGENDNNETETDESTLINREMPESTIANANEKEISTQDTTTFHQIQAAYHCLRDPNKRCQYDESISRKEEREEWKWRGALQVNLSEMECDWCCVVDEDNSDSEGSVDQAIDATDGDTPPLQKVFFQNCRCGDTFQVVQEELLESLGDANIGCGDKNDVFTNRVWQCESCSLTIQIHVDIDID